ncbi:MAG: hypothetical protein R2875_09975 [Desulfobacterales bacterium]
MILIWSLIGALASFCLQPYGLPCHLEILAGIHHPFHCWGPWSVSGWWLAVFPQSAGEKLGMVVLSWIVSPVFSLVISLMFQLDC